MNGVSVYMLKTAPMGVMGPPSLRYGSCAGTHQCKVKGKAIPLQAWTGPEGSRRLRLPDFKTIST